MSASHPLGGEESANSVSATNLASLLVDLARERPQRSAIKLDDVEGSYEQLDEGNARVAGLLKTKGISPGDRVDIMLPNVPHFALAYYGPCVPEGSCPHERAAEGA